MPGPDLLFVYGTLRRGFGHPLHGEIERQSRFLGLARFEGFLYDLGPYPAVVPAPPGLGGVTGEVYALANPGPLLNTLDLYEGCMEECPDDGKTPSGYRRERVPVKMENGDTVSVWIYLYNNPPPEARRIPGGDYLAGRIGTPHAHRRDSSGDDGAP